MSFRFFSLPAFSDEKQAFLARQILANGWSLLVVLPAMTILFVLIWPRYLWFGLGIIAAASAAAITVIALARSGRLRLSGALLVIEMWLLITIFAFLPVGLGARAAWGFFIVVFNAGLLFGRWASVVAAAGCSLTTLAIAFIPRVASPHPWLFWLVNTLYLLVMIFLQSLTGRSINEATAKIRVELHGRQHAETALYESERKHREMVNNLPFCVFEADLSGRLTFVNRTALEVFGFSEAGFSAGINLLDVVADVDKQRTRESLSRIASGEEVNFHEYLVKRRDGSLFHALIRTRRIYENGVPIGLQGSLIDISQRKEIEKDRELVISLLKATVESTKDGILVIDQAGKITHYNQRFVQMWQIPDDIMALGLDSTALEFARSQLIDPQGFVDRVKALYTDSLAESYDLLEFKDGRYFERYSRPQLLDGLPVGRVWSFRDITEHKRAEKEISDWKQRFENVTAASNQIVYDYDFATSNIQWSGSIEKVLGYQLDEMNGGLTRWEDLIAPQDREEATRLLDISVKNGTLYQVEYGFKHKRGHFVRIFDRGLVMHDAAGRPERMIGMMQDITERKKTEEALQESERRYRAVFEAAGDGIFLMHGTRFVDCNAKTLELFGCSRDFFASNYVDQLSPEKQPDGMNSREKAKEKLQAALDGIPQRFDWIHLRGDGTPFPAEVSLNRVELSSGTYTLAVIRDISDRRMLEGQLLQAQKMEAIGILAGGVAHDFNNILSTIVGYASLLQMKIKGDEQLKDYAERILASTERAVSLTHSLLAFSRKQEIELQPVDINSAISGFHKILTRLIGEDIDFSLDLAEQSLVVDVDVRQLEQVLMNMATNSRDAMPNGGKLTIATSSIILDEVTGEIPIGAYVLISITDTGCGMDEKVQAHLFEPFFTTKEVGKGTGLGLAIVYGIIKKHNGFIRVRSTVGRGAVFDIYLPLRSLHREKRTHRKSEKSMAGTETILLIEDDATVRHVMRSILDEFGYKVIEAADGVEAVALFAHEWDRVQLILCDLIMPKKNGRETIAEIRGIKPDVKVIFISGYAADIIARKGIMDPGIPMLLKPLKPSELLVKVRQFLDS